VDETYIRVKGKWVYLYRALDSSGATIDFLLSAKRDAAAAERFLAKALGGENHPAPRVINTDEHAGYPPAIVRLKAEEALEENCRHRPVQYLNNVLEQDHRAIKRRVRAKPRSACWSRWRIARSAAAATSGPRSGRFPKRSRRTSGERKRRVSFVIKKFKIYFYPLCLDHPRRSMCFARREKFLTYHKLSWPEESASRL